MQTLTLKTYKFDELSPEAKEKAREWFRKGNEYPFLNDCMENWLRNQLDTQGITLIGEDRLKIFYSLSCCQGDGAMFEAALGWGGYEVTVRHSGHYYHENSKEFEIFNAEGERVDNSELEDRFDAWYTDLCKELARVGYSFMDAEDSDESVEENIRSNDYDFTENGTRSFNL